MSVLRIIAKILLFPVVGALMLIQWVGIFLNSISGVLLGILAFIFALTGAASLTFGLASGPEALKMIVAGFMIFMIPAVGEWVLTIIMAIRIWVCTFFRA